MRWKEIARIIFWLALMVGLWQFNRFCARALKHDRNSVESFPVPWPRSSEKPDATSDWLETKEISRNINVDFIPYLHSDTHDGLLMKMQFLDQGQKLLSFANDRSMVLWDLFNLNKSKRIFTLVRQDASPLWIVAPDESMVAQVRGGFYIFFINLPSGSSNHMLSLSSRITDIAFSPEGRYLAVGLDSLNVQVFFRKKEPDQFVTHVIREIPTSSSISHLVYLPQNLLVFTRARELFFLDSQNKFQVKKKDKSPVMEVDCTAAYPADNMLTVIGKDYQLFLLSAGGTKIEAIELPPDFRPSATCFTSNGHILAINTLEGQQFLYLISQKRIIFSRPSSDKTNGLHYCIASSQCSGQTFFATDVRSNEVDIWNRQGQTVLYLEDKTFEIPTLVATAKDGKIGFATHSTPENLLAYGFDPIKVAFSNIPPVADLTMTVWDNGVVRLVSNPDLAARLSRDCENGCPLEVIDIIAGSTVQGRIVRDATAPNKWTLAGKRFVAAGGLPTDLLLYDLLGTPQALLYGHMGNINSLTSTLEGDWLVSTSMDRSINWWWLPAVFSQKGHFIGQGEDSPGLEGLDRLTCQSYLDYKFQKNLQQIRYSIKLLVTPNQEWLAICPEFFYVGSSPRALNMMSYYFSLGAWDVVRYLPSGMFYDVFYRPELVRLKMLNPNSFRLFFENKGHIIAANILTALVKEPAPKVTIVAPEDLQSIADFSADIKVQISDAGGGIGEIRLYQNGKIVSDQGFYLYNSPEGAELKKEPLIINDEQIRQGQELLRTYRIALVSGKNEIFCQAKNRNGTLISGLANICLDAAIPPSIPKMHVLAIGIEEFQDSRFNLNLAADDAMDISALLQNKKYSKYEIGTIQCLLNPTKKKIYATMLDFATWMNPEDIFILFISTHGTLRKLPDRQTYCLLTADFAGSLDDSNTLSSEELLDFSRLCPALQQAIILDTCHAGAADWQFQDFYQNRLAAFAFGSGVHLLAACSSQQVSLEGFNGHGIFSYFLIQGISGEADNNKDGVVMLSELAAYVKKELDDFVEIDQKPVISIFGNDFVVAANK